MLHIAVTFILVNDVTELVNVQELYQLREYVFRFVHMQSSILAAKIQNQIDAPEKSL